MNKAFHFAALLVSRTLDPLILFSFLFLYILLFEIGIGSREFLGALGFILVELAVPIGWLVYLIKKGEIDYDISDKEKRGRFLLPVVIFLTMMLPILVYLSINKLFLFFQILAIVFVTAWLIINRFYKISGHVGSLTMVGLIFSRIFGWGNFWFLLVLVLAWSRVELKKHTWGQVIGGFLVSFLLGNIMLVMGGY